MFILEKIYMYKKYILTCFSSMYVFFVFLQGGLRKNITVERKKLTIIYFRILEQKSFLKMEIIFYKIYISRTGSSGGGTRAMFLG